MGLLSAALPTALRLHAHPHACSTAAMTAEQECRRLCLSTLGQPVWPCPQRRGCKEPWLDGSCYVLICISTCRWHELARVYRRAASRAKHIKVLKSTSCCCLACC